MEAMVFHNKKIYFSGTNSFTSLKNMFSREKMFLNGLLKILKHINKFLVR